MQQLEIIKLINLGDVKGLLNLGVTGLKLDAKAEKLHMSKDGTHLISRSESKESIDLQFESSKQLIEEYLEGLIKGKKTLNKEENPVNINFKITDDGITPLMLACTSGNIEIVKLILANPTLDLHKRDNSGINSLYVSAYYGHFEVFKLLRRQGAEYQVSEKGSTILHVVCKKGFNEILKYLLHEP